MSQARGIDISDSMVHEYNRRARSLGLNAEQMSATQGNIFTPQTAIASTSSASEPEYFDFDLAIVNMGFHHFENPTLAATRLVERLKPKEGVLVVVDFLPHDPLHGGKGNHQHHPKHEHTGRPGNHGHNKQQQTDASDNDVSKTVAHHGFAMEQIKAIFSVAGCDDFDYSVFREPVRFGDDLNGIERKVFIARGRRAT